MDTIEELAGKMDFLISSSLALPCELAHYSIVISGVKQTWGEGQSRSQPFATWFMSIICCFGGSCLTNLATGNPPLLPLTNTQSILYASVVWWLIFYSPKNLFSSLLQWTPLSLVALLLKEMIRTRKIMKGVKLGRAAYPSSFLLCTVMGMLCACGGGFIKGTALMLRSQWNKDSIKNFSFSVVTKCCLIFSALYNLQIDGDLPLSMKAVALLQVSVMYMFIFGSKFGFAADPLSPLEGIVSSLFVDYSAFSSPAPPTTSQPAKTTAKKSNKHRKEE